MRLIDADAFKEWVDKYYDCTDLGDIVMRWIDERPTIEAEPVRRGKWKIKKASIHPYGNDVCCSECGFRMGSSFGYKFCPNCGAYMEV